MRRIARISDADRADLFRATSRKVNLPEAVIEKDFWVCYVLDALFHRCAFHNGVVFKGGTSLSKGFGLIQRFSEDVDLILDWRLLGYGVDEPWRERSNTGQEKFKHEAADRACEFLLRGFVPELQRVISSDLGTKFAIYPDESGETAIFEYPRLFSSRAMLDVIRLEVGPLAAWSPSSPVGITPYAAEQFPRVFENPATLVRTADPERTFWEKATILHQEANRPASKPMPKRYARHYYDMYRLGNSEVLESALTQANLLDRVIDFKEKFYRTPWAKLSEARVGTLKLAPRDCRLDELRADYASMRDMLFGDIPEFDEIVLFMGELETRINQRG